MHRAGPSNVSLKLPVAQVDTAGLALVDSRAVPAASTRFLQGGQATCCRFASCPAGVARGLLILRCGADATARKVYANLPLVEMHAPVVGPAHPFQKDGIAAGMKNHRSGYVEVRQRAPAVQSLRQLPCADTDGVRTAGLPHARLPLRQPVQHLP